MKKRMKLGATIAVCTLLLTVMGIYSVPKLRAAFFVNLYYELIEENLRVNNGVPADDAVFLGYKSVNSWNAVHPMTEFVIMSFGNTYYGCYYSPDDVPLAFQNKEVPLNQEGKNTWKWESEEDNRGLTSKIRECWYFFSASF